MRWTSYKKNAFTIIEILIVVVIIGILAAALVPRLQRTQERAYDVKLEKEVRDLQSALFLYRSDKGEYPNSTFNRANTCINTTAAYAAKWQGVMNELSGYITNSIKWTHEWPYCIYYFRTYWLCDFWRDRWYAVIFATRGMEFPQYDLYGVQWERKVKARYCVYPTVK